MSAQIGSICFREARQGVGCAGKAKGGIRANASDYAAAAAVIALLDARYHVLVDDDSFDDGSAWDRFCESHACVVRVSGEPPTQIYHAAWAVRGRVDAIVSNAHFPAVHRATQDVSLEDRRLTFEKLVVKPFAVLKASIPRFA